VLLIRRLLLRGIFSFASVFTFHRIDCCLCGTTRDSSSHETLKNAERSIVVVVSDESFHLLVHHEFDGCLGRNFDHIDAVASPQARPATFLQHVSKAIRDSLF
jgi:hypothetical protein